ncbi:MAG: DUF1592 domain-containing protein [Planctomycetota bacterium]
MELLRRPFPARPSLAVLALAVAGPLAWTRPALVLAPTLDDGAVLADEYAETIKPIFEITCFQCHGEADQKAGFRLDELDPDFVEGEDAEDWDYVLELIRGGDMPPSRFERQLTDDERRAVVGWLERGLEAAARAHEGDVGPVLRRLNRAQYSATLQELLGLSIDFARDLPSDARSKTGFTNNGEVLQASTLHLESYQAIARAALHEAIALGGKPDVTRYRVRFGRGMGKGLVAGRTGGYQSVPLPTDDFTVEVLDDDGAPKGASATDAEREALDAIRKRISVGLRGSGQNRFRVAEDGLVLYGAVPHKEKAPGAWQGPSPNVKLEMRRVFPERGDVMMRVTASRGSVWRSREPVLLQLDGDPARATLAAAGDAVEVTAAADSLVALATKSDQRKNATLAGDLVRAEDVTEPCQARVRFEVPAEGYYQVDLVHPPVPREQMPSIRLTYAGKTLDLRPELTEAQLAEPRVVTTVGAAYVRKGRQHMKVGGPFFPGFSHVILTPLAEQHPLVLALSEATEDLEARYAGADPVLRAFAGTRTDDGMDYREFAGAEVVSAPRGAAETYSFLGRLENLPIPEPESGDTEILSGFLLLGVWNDFLIKDRRSPGPPLLIESIEVEAPYLPTWPSVSHTSIFVTPKGDGDEDAHAREILLSFMARAFRDWDVESDVDLYHDFWRAVRPEVETFEESILETLVAVLCSPRFLFLVEPERGGDTPGAPAGQAALAARLSYFLWNGPPDEELSSLAFWGRLEDRLEEQVDRMLDDPRSRRFVDSFAHEWLRLDRLDNMTIDPDMYPAFTRFVKRDMREETLAFVHRVLKDDLDLMTLVDSDFAMLNQNLAEFYGVEGVAGPHFRPVEIPREMGRGGLLSHGAFLAGHSDGQEPHPIKRAVWLKERILGDPPPPPPPNVPDLDAEAPEMKGLTLQEQLALHRDNPSCRDCHAGIDPFGVAFERYDAVGLIRDERKGRAIDASVVLPDGTEVDGVRDLKAYLAGPARGEFVGSVVEHLFAYANGRDVSFADEAEIEAIARRIESNGGTARAAIKAVVTSPSFRR